MHNLLTLPNQRSRLRWTGYLAIGIAEGFIPIPDEEDSDTVRAEAWAIVIKYKLHNKLRKWYGKNARALVVNGTILDDGTIDWDSILLGELGTT